MFPEGERCADGAFHPLRAGVALLLSRVEARRLDPSGQYALIAAREAWSAAGSPEVEPERLCDLEALIVTEARAAVPPNALRRLAALLPADPVQAEKTGGNNSFSSPYGAHFPAACSGAYV